MTTQNLTHFVKGQWYSIKDYDGFVKAHRHNKSIINFINKNGGFFKVLSVNWCGSAEAIITLSQALCGAQDIIDKIPEYSGIKTSNEYFFILPDEAKYFKLETLNSAANDDEYEASEENEIPHITLAITNKNQVKAAIEMLKGLL
ncbi:hypothetical protein CPTAKMNP4_013 [Salmonella phage vB_SenM-AKM_NP4]|uniref:Uncharacterized protein n=2 Tax=Gelderlandvirus TaxID=1913653 RepID=M1EB43_BPS16|nr:hypothetical protein I133_gp258 [Salmonella phage vB_SenM-S16]YP_009126217.1 hypothetical protein STP4a_008 [Salmonella phage STP4-a]WDR21679.1 hypothetical protein PJM34_0011 [Salmonella phage vB_SenM_UTK0003]WKV23358.1 hypothetical protein SEA1_gp0010 [Salmonella phage SEA1]WLI71638.1 hypothetical protein CPTAKMNP4_013 [Salmonella phage vB_SenM-AKM_NP4]AEO97008.1 hypothetical protein [Salmonella phage vB_SenM-S16]AHJ86864.1 hypothetical protein STP4a_008 [Salmonella phage STP4-a]